MKSFGPRYQVMKGKLRPAFVFQVVFLFHVVVFHPHLLRGQAAAPAAGTRTIHGVVKSGNMPIPGAEVSADERGHERTSQYLNRCGWQLHVADSRRWALHRGGADGGVCRERAGSGGGCNASGRAGEF